MKKLQLSVLPSVEGLMIDIAIREYDGKVSKYVTDLIYTDLIQRTMLDKMAVQIIKETTE